MPARSVMRRLAARREDGYVLPMVIGITIVLLIMVATAVTATLSGSKKSYSDVEWNAALSAAYAGIEDYKSRIELDSSYLRFGNVASDFTPASATTVMPTGAYTNPAFNVGASEPWAVVPHPASEPDRAWFRYEVDNSELNVYGIVRVRATGKVGDATRSVVAELKQQTYTDYIYWTYYEVQDPVVSGLPDCEKFYWPRTGAARSTDCGITFASGDELHGDVRSNDALLINCGARFYGEVLSASEGITYYTTNGSATQGACANSTFPGAVEGGGQPQTVPLMSLPLVNTALINEVYVTRTDNPGCLYTGPTVIVIGQTAGYMRVWSPWTIHTQLTESGFNAAADVNSKCGLPGSGTGALGSAAGALIPIPQDNVVYVQDVPTAAGDPNRPPTVTSSTSSFPSGYTSGNWQTGSGTGSKYRVASNNWIFLPKNLTCSNQAAAGEGFAIPGSSNLPGRSFGIGFPIGSEATPAGADSTHPAYGCRKGDAYVQTTGSKMTGHLTVAASNYIYALGNIEYGAAAAGQYNVLGMVASNAIFVWRPINGSGNNLLSDTNRTIYGALASTGHTIQVQNFKSGSCNGTLSIYGSIIQRFRGPVGTGGTPACATGYLKNYNWDPNFQYVTPPKFITPNQTTYTINQTIGVQPAFAPDGSTI